MLALIADLADKLAPVAFLGATLWAFGYWAYTYLGKPLYGVGAELVTDVKEIKSSIGTKDSADPSTVHGSINVVRHEVIRQGDELARVATLPDILSVPIMEADPLGMVIYVNNALVSSLGYYLEDVRGVNWRVMVADVDRERYFSDLEHARVNGSGLERRIHLLDVQGRPFPLPWLARTVPVTAHDGRIIRWRTTFHAADAELMDD